MYFETSNTSGRQISSFKMHTHIDLRIHAPILTLKQIMAKEKLLHFPENFLPTLGATYFILELSLY